MIVIYPNEEFREIEIEKSLKLRYAISNTGKLISFTDKFHDGRILNGSLIEGYRIFRYRFNQNGITIRKHFFYFRLVAEYFIPKTSDDQTFVLHLNYDKADDRVENLRWATKEEMMAHATKSPHVILAIQRMKEHKVKHKGRKLTAPKVLFIKRMIDTKKTRQSMIAKQFGVSCTQIKRIERNENWKNVMVKA